MTVTQLMFLPISSLVSMRLLINYAIQTFGIVISKCRVMRHGICEGNNVWTNTVVHVLSLSAGIFTNF